MDWEERDKISTNWSENRGITMGREDIFMGNETILMDDNNRVKYEESEKPSTEWREQ